MILLVGTGEPLPYCNKNTLGKIESKFGIGRPPPPSVGTKDQIFRQIQFEGSPYLIVWVPATHIHYIGLRSVDARLENCVSLNHTFVVKLTMSGTLRAFSCGVSAMVSSVMTPLKSQFF